MTRNCRRAILPVVLSLVLALGVSGRARAADSYGGMPAPRYREDCPVPLAGVEVSEPHVLPWSGGRWVVFSTTLLPPDATQPITYTWAPEPPGPPAWQYADRGASTSYSFSVPGAYSVTVTAENCGGLASDTAHFVVTFFEVQEPKLDWGYVGRVLAFNLVGLAGLVMPVPFLAAFASQRRWLAASSPGLCGTAVIIALSILSGATSLRSPEFLGYLPAVGLLFSMALIPLSIYVLRNRWVGVLHLLTVAGALWTLFFTWMAIRHDWL